MNTSREEGREELAGVYVCGQSCLVEKRPGERRKGGRQRNGGKRVGVFENKIVKRTKKGTMGVNYRRKR